MAVCRSPRHLVVGLEFDLLEVCLVVVRGAVGVGAVPRGSGGGLHDGCRRDGPPFTAEPAELVIRDVDRPLLGRRVVAHVHVQAVGTPDLPVVDLPTVVEDPLLHLGDLPVDRVDLLHEEVGPQVADDVRGDPDGFPHLAGALPVHLADLLDHKPAETIEVLLVGFELLAVGLRVLPPVVARELLLAHPPGLVACLTEVDAVVELHGPRGDHATIHLADEHGDGVDLVEEGPEVIRVLALGLDRAIHECDPLVFERMLDLRVGGEAPVGVAEIRRDPRMEVAPFRHESDEDGVVLLLELAQIGVERERTRVLDADGLELVHGLLVTSLGLGSGVQVRPHGVRAEELDPDGQGLEDDQEGLDAVPRVAHVRVVEHELCEDPSLVQDAEIDLVGAPVLARERVRAHGQDLVPLRLAAGGELGDLGVDLVVERLDLAGGFRLEPITPALRRLLVGELGAVSAARASTTGAGQAAGLARGSSRSSRDFAVEHLTACSVPREHGLLAPAAVGLAHALCVGRGVADGCDARIVAGELLIERSPLDGGDVLFLLTLLLGPDLRAEERQLSAHHVVPREDHDGGDADRESEERLEILPEHTNHRLLAQPHAEVPQEVEARRHDLPGHVQGHHEGRRARHEGDRCRDLEPQRQRREEVPGCLRLDDDLDQPCDERHEGHDAHVGPDRLVLQAVAEGKQSEPVRELFEPPDRLLRLGRCVRCHHRGGGCVDRRRHQCRGGEHRLRRSRDRCCDLRHVGRRRSRKTRKRSVVGHVLGPFDVSRESSRRGVAFGKAVVRSNVHPVHSVRRSQGSEFRPHGLILERGSKS